MKQVDLFFQEGSSDKVYHIQLEKKDSGFVVNFQYGRRGNALQSGSKTPTPVSEAEAIKIFNKLEKEKRAKGYDTIEDGEKKNNFSGQVAVQRKDVIILPQLLNTIEDVEAYIKDPSYLAQEKMDGERRMLISNGEVIGLNKKGQQVQLPNSIINSVKDEYILDGEIIGDKLFVFDILSLRGNDLKSYSCMQRLAFLNTLEFGENIEIVFTAHSEEEKRELFEKLKRENKEGIVFKTKINSPYTAGRPASGGTALKFKFHKTATFIVEGTTKGKRSVGLNILDGDKKVFMGKVTIPPNHEVPSEGELVEVRYLYAYKGGAVFQPVYLGKRPDSDLTDATIKQIVYKAEVE